jgi:hypothetical protein
MCRTVTWCLTGGIVLLTLGLVIVGILQWSVMSGQLTEMKGSSTQTDKLIEKTRTVASNVFGTGWSGTFRLRFNKIALIVSRSTAGPRLRPPASPPPRPPVAAAGTGASLLGTRASRSDRASRASRTNRVRGSRRGGPGLRRGDTAMCRWSRPDPDRSSRPPCRRTRCRPRRAPGPDRRPEPAPCASEQIV